jgi:hypothetical protein
MKHLFEFEGFLNEGASVQASKFNAKEIFNGYKEEKTKSPVDFKSASFVPTIRLTDQKVRDGIFFYAYTRDIDLGVGCDKVRKGTYDYPLRTEADIRKYCHPIEGVTYSVVNDNTIKFIFPEGELDPYERAVILVKIKGLVNPRKPTSEYFFLSSFDKPVSGVSGDDAVWVHNECKGLDDPKIKGSIWKNSQKIPRNVPGGYLNVQIDMTKVTGYRLYHGGPGSYRG